MGRRACGWAAAALTGLVLAGCGSGDGAGAGDAATTTTTATPTTTTAPSRRGSATGTSTDAAPPAIEAAPPSVPEAEDDAGAADWCPITTAQVSAVVDHEVIEGQPCTWSAPDLTAAVLEVYVSGTDAGHLAESSDAVDGVGDAAAYDVSGALVFERAGTYWVVQVLNMGGASDIVAKDAEVELAELVLSGIG